MSSLFELYQATRGRTLKLSLHLSPEDVKAQPAEFVSPPQWHLAHTTWFFETFLLKAYDKDYQEIDPAYSFLFNSYYDALGDRLPRPSRGQIVRPTFDEVLEYRKTIDAQMSRWLANVTDDEKKFRVVLGIHHEQQHQELLITDIKYILGQKPFFPPYSKTPLFSEEANPSKREWISMNEGVYEVGYQGDDFCYDNELPCHKVYLKPYQIAAQLVTNEEYLEFIRVGGYNNHEYWHSDGWDWVKKNQIQAPLYWQLSKNQWHEYQLNGLAPLPLHQPVCHVSFYEAAAFAEWKGNRLPTEYEWEVGSPQLKWGSRWEWTGSAYLPYPGYQKFKGALGEYNAKFMVNQMVLRGASVATPMGHSRRSYRNYFYPDQRWQYTGIRLAQGF